MRTAKRAIVASVTVIVLIAAAAALADAPQPGSSFSGKTSQTDGSVSFGVSPDGTVVTNFQAIMSARCTRENKPEVTIEVGLTPTRRIKIVEGVFRYIGGIELYNGSDLIGSGKNGEVQGGFTSPTTASGTLKFEWQYFSNAGSARGYKCRTGVVSFQASPAGPSQPGPGKGPGSGSPSSCVVPKLKGKKLKAAKRATRRGNCRPGRIVRRHSARVRAGRVIAQKPAAGSRMDAGAKVKLVVSSGPKP
jgi:PASTA domain